MAIERTLSIIKPDATERNLTGAVNAQIEKARLRIIAQKRVRWSKAQADKAVAPPTDRVRPSPRGKGRPPRYVTASGRASSGSVRR